MGPFLGTVVKNTEHKKVVPGINLYFLKLNRLGLVGYLPNSLNALASHGLDNIFIILCVHKLMLNSLNEEIMSENYETANLEKVSCDIK